MHIDADAVSEAACRWDMLCVDCGQAGEACNERGQKAGAGDCLHAGSFVGVTVPENEDRRYVLGVANAIACLHRAAARWRPDAAWPGETPRAAPLRSGGRAVSLRSSAFDLYQQAFS